MVSRKVKRYRGSKTHGCGSMKKRRGAGHRGGRGNAGSGKRGDGKKPSFWARGRQEASGSKKNYTTINVVRLDACIGSWVAEKKASEKEGFYIVDLSKLGYTKLLGSGTVKHKYKIQGVVATEGAVKKITACGGEVQK